MSGFSGRREPETQQCIHCGKQIRLGVRQCPYCREAQAEHRPGPTTSPKVQTSGLFRSGLLLMLLAAAIHYFAGGYSPVVLPGEVTPALTFLTPVIFVGGLATSLWGFFQRVRT